MLINTALAYTHADLAARAAKRTRVLGGFFGGLGFLLTGFKTQQAAEREITEASIQHNGGVLVSLPPLPSQTRPPLGVATNGAALVAMCPSVLLLWGWRVAGGQLAGWQPLQPCTHAVWGGFCWAWS